ncbi:MAG: ThaI family type II restriction endonuclease [Candidatus Kryptonium sp.]
MLFQIAESEISRGGKIGMEVGTLREQIIISLLMYKFGEANVKVDEITKAEEDVKVFGESVSIKTKTDKNLQGVKLIWTVDWEKVEEFKKNYEPRSHFLFVQVVWNDIGNFYFIPLKAQLEVFKTLGRESYLKLPKKGTNPRGVEISKEALENLINHPDTRKIEIYWLRDNNVKVNPYKRWLDLWAED